MRRSVWVLLVAVLLTACGGSTSAGGGGGGGGGGTAEVPPATSAWFGSSFDPTTFGVIGHVPTVKQGSPIVAVGHTLGAHDTTGMKVTISIGGSVRQTLPVAGGAADVVAADLSGAGLGPGIYIVSFIDAKGTILATGNLNITAP